MSSLNIGYLLKSRSITISRQMGSLGREIASQVAARLGFRLLWRELVDEAALRADVPELALAAVDELHLLELCPSPAACQAYLSAMQEVLMNLAQEGGCVLVGRAGMAILHDVPGVIHIFVTAPPDVRAKRVAAHQSITLECAREQVLTSDQFRIHFMKKYYHLRWDDPSRYDLVINTGHIPPETAANLVIQTLEASLIQPIPESKN